MQQPFLKWAGGKRWLAEKYSGLLDVKFERYIEPFLGSGAIFFKLRPKSSIISDTNGELIQTYKSIKSNWREVELLLRQHHSKHSKSYYYYTRQTKLKSSTEKAAQFIYLNRTCWNGLYRVNLSGHFNVPIGTKSRVILETDNFEEVSRLLKNADIRNCDFEAAIDEASFGDFIFADPPYTVKHNHNGFIKYNESLFSWDDQIRLRDCIIRAVGRGAKAVVTNACHENIKELYKGVGDFTELRRESVIAGSNRARGRFEEIVIRCG